MPETTKNDDDTKSPPSLSMVLLLIGTFLDTTWRLFLPTIGGTVAGIWIDNSFDTKPFATVAGVTIGALLAFFLIYIQLKKVKP